MVQRKLSALDRLNIADIDDIDDFAIESLKDKYKPTKGQKLTVAERQELAADKMAAENADAEAAALKRQLREQEKQQKAYDDNNSDGDIELGDEEASDDEEADPNEMDGFIDEGSEESEGEEEAAEALANQKGSAYDYVWYKTRGQFQPAVGKLPAGKFKNWKRWNLPIGADFRELYEYRKWKNLSPGTRSEATLLGMAIHREEQQFNETGEAPEDYDTLVNLKARVKQLIARDNDPTSFDRVSVNADGTPYYKIPKNPARTRKPVAGVPLDDEEKRTRDIAAVAYEAPAQRPTALGAYRYDAGLSNERTAVYASPTKAYIGYRGTDPTSKQDLEEDAYIAAGMQRGRPRYSQALTTFDAVAAKHTPNIVLSGHSSGGSVAQNTSQLRSATAHTFNTGRGLDAKDLVDKARCSLPGAPAWCGKLTRHVMFSDKLSERDRQGYGRIKVYNRKQQGTLANHGIAAYY